MIIKKNRNIENHLKNIINWFKKKTEHKQRKSLQKFIQNHCNLFVNKKEEKHNYTMEWNVVRIKIIIRCKILSNKNTWFYFEIAHFRHKKNWTENEIDHQKLKSVVHWTAFQCLLKIKFLFCFNVQPSFISNFSTK